MTAPRITTPFGFTSTAAEVIAGVDLSGKRAIVTGASSGIGVETARALADAGAAVTLAVRNTEAGERVAAEIREGSRKEAQEMITRAREEIVLERDKAQAALRNEVVDLAVEIAGKLMREELTAEKHRKLVDGFLAEVEEVK